MFFRGYDRVASVFPVISKETIRRNKVRYHWLRRVWWRRYLYSSFFRLLSWAIGLTLIAIGILLAPSPLPLGFIFFIIGFYFIARRSRLGRGLFRRIRRIIPPFSRALNRAKIRLPRSVQIFIERSDPGV